MPKSKIQYFPYVYNAVFGKEVLEIIPHLQGKGIEVGSGLYGVIKGNVRVDIDKNVLPDICCSCEKLLVKDNEFDYLVAMHILEHLHNPESALKEWRRVIKHNGLIALVHPDLRYTGKQKPLSTNPDKNPFNQHTYEMHQDEFIDWFYGLAIIGLEIIGYGTACPKWSFYVLFRKVKI